MLADRYDLPLSTASSAARDAYVEGCDLALTLYPGAIEAFDRAIAADPGFALAHAGKAQVLMREGNVAAARAALAAVWVLGTPMQNRTTVSLPVRPFRNFLFRDYRREISPRLANTNMCSCQDDFFREWQNSPDYNKGRPRKSDHRIGAD